jgi:hypothetical protein
MQVRTEFSGMQPPSAPPMMDAGDARMAKLRAVAGQHEIKPEWVAKLRQLEGMGLALICDDSGSMNSPVHGGGSTRNAYSKQHTRWDELCGTVCVIVELMTALNGEGVDVFFLNRPPMLGVKSAAQVVEAFRFAAPAGYTPLTRVVQQVLAVKQPIIRERKLLLLIATDGQPTDDAGTVNIGAFLQTLRSMPPTVFVQIMACTDDDASVSYLNEADRDIARVDVTDDYASERKEILRAQGERYPFSFGDYVVKALLGPIDNSFDKLDAVTPGGCCTIA